MDERCKTAGATAEAVGRALDVSCSGRCWAMTKAGVREGREEVTQGISPTGGGAHRDHDIGHGDHRATRGPLADAAADAPAVA